MAGNEETYEDQLEERSASVSVLLGRLRNSGVYKSIESQSLNLSKDEIVLLLDAEVIPWSWLRKEIIASIDGCKAIKKGQVASRVKRHTKKCGQLQLSMSKTTVPTVVLPDRSMKKVEWESSLSSLSIVFTTELHTSLGRSDDNMDMVANVNALLVTDIQPPEDKGLVETWYHVSSWLVFAMRKLGKRRKEGELAKALEVFAKSACTTREEAKSNASLPTGRTVAKEKYDGLTYASAEFFSFFVKLETLYETLLADKLFMIWGPMLIEHINDGIIRSTLSIEVFLPQVEDEETRTSVFQLMLLTYGHLRGKDFMKRKNALAKGNLTVAHRSQIAAISNPQLRGGKKTKNEKVDADNTASSVRTGDTASTTDSSIVSTVDDIGPMMEEAWVDALVEFELGTQEVDSDNE